MLPVRVSICVSVAVTRLPLAYSVTPPTNVCVPADYTFTADDAGTLPSGSSVLKVTVPA